MIFFAITILKKRERTISSKVTPCLMKMLDWSDDRFIISMLGYPHLKMHFLKTHCSI
jgi:hypothetical protein